MDRLCAKVMIEVVGDAVHDQQVCGANQIWSGLESGIEGSIAIHAFSEFLSLIQKNDEIFFLLMLALPMSLEPLTDQQPSGMHEFEYCGQDV